MSGVTARVVRAVAVHADCWARMRMALWPDASQKDHQTEIADILATEQGLVAFVALNRADEAVAFVEAALRHDYVNGGDTSPVLFVEGLYVTPDIRRTAVGRALIRAVAAWGREQGCTEMASDADIANLSSHAFHQAAGFAETERVVYFRKLIG